MIHYTCDGCKRRIDATDELRYVVRLEVYPALDPTADGTDDERDHLQEIQDFLEGLDEPIEADICHEVYHKTKLDLCSDCRHRFVNDPLGRPTPTQLNFSQN